MEQKKLPEEKKQSPKVETDYIGKWKSSDWDEYLTRAVEAYGLTDVKPNDFKDYIDSWPETREGKIAFWSNILVMMAKYESNWNPATKYNESFGVTSRGLFQISVPSVNQTRYGCDVKNEMDLHLPAINIDCAVKVFAYWVKTDRVIRGYKGGAWSGVAKYWSCIRGVSSAHTKEAWSAIKAANR